MNTTIIKHNTEMQKKMCIITTQINTIDKLGMQIIKEDNI